MVVHICWVRTGQRTISLCGKKYAYSHYCFLPELVQAEAVEYLIESSLVCLCVCVCVCVYVAVAGELTSSIVLFHKRERT